MCPISLWEVAVLVRKGRVSLDRDPHVWARDLFDDDRLDVAPLSPTAAISAGLLPDDGFDGDPADCMVYATARELGATLVTKDRRMHDYARAAKGVRVVW